MEFKEFARQSEKTAAMALLPEQPTAVRFTVSIGTLVPFPFSRHPSRIPAWYALNMSGL